MVMFHGMDRHSGIRTGSQDAARTAAGHSAQDTASRDTESPGENMTVSAAQSGQGSSGLIQIRTGFFFLFFNFFFSCCCSVRRQVEGGAAFLCRLPPPPLPQSLLLHSSPPHLSFYFFFSKVPSPLILPSKKKKKIRFLLDEKSTRPKPLKACYSTFYGISGKCSHCLLTTHVKIICCR